MGRPHSLDVCSVMLEVFGQGTSSSSYSSAKLLYQSPEVTRNHDKIIPVLIMAMY